MAEATDQAHAVELAGALLEAADQQHFAVPGQELVAGNASIRGGRGRRLPRLPSGGWTRHSLLPSTVRTGRTQGPSGPDADHIVPRIGKSQQGPGALVEKIGGNRLVPEQSRPRFELCALAGQGRQLSLAVHQGLVPLAGGQDAPVARQGVEAEIEDQQAERRRRPVGAQGL